jgi:hypothetical protein
MVSSSTNGRPKTETSSGRLKPPWKELLLRAAGFLVVVAILRLAWTPVGPHYFSMLISISKPLAAASGLTIGSPQFEEATVVIPIARWGTSSTVRWERGVENYLPFDLLVFLGLVLGASLRVLVGGPGRSLLKLMIGVTLLVGVHVGTVLVQVLMVSIPTVPSHDVRWLGSLLQGIAPFLPFGLWIVLFTSLPNRMSRAARRSRNLELSS